ncbi:MAG: hypothetical protein OXF41_11330 [bacterium]|nr:hypothetical protein [bacterium]
MAVDLAGFITDMKAHAVEHGFHVHAERHFIESYSLGQAWEVDLHPEEACEGPLEMLMVLEVDPRVILAFDDLIAGHLEIEEEQDGKLQLPLFFKWALPPLPNPPDLLILATELAGVSGTTLPVEVSATDTYMSVTDAPTRSLSLVGRLDLPLRKMFMRELKTCDVLECAHGVSMWLLGQADDWLGGGQAAPS